MILLQKQKNKQNNNGESGNVLFLILIAVALFAALSYAVTQSTRTGGGSGDNETALISSAQLTQYPASIRTSVVRMIIGGVNATDLEFNAPSAFPGCTAGNDFCVFHPSGGGATYGYAPTNMMASAGGNLAGEWRFNGENQIDLLGTTNGGGPDASSADIIAFLPGISLTLCSRINQELGLPTSPPAEADADYVIDMTNPDAANPVGIGASGGTIGDAAGTHALDGQPFGCFDDGGTYVYYHVLVER